MIKAQWDRLDPKYKRIAAITAGSGIVLSVITLFAGEPPKEERNSRNDTVRHILTDRDTRNVSIDGLAAQVEIANEQGDEMRREIDTLRRLLHQNKREEEEDDQLREEVENLREEVQLLTEQNLELIQRPSSSTAPSKAGSDGEWESRQSPPQYDPIRPTDRSGSDGQKDSSAEGEIDPVQVFREAPLPNISNNTVQPTQGRAASQPSAASPGDEGRRQDRRDPLGSPQDEPQTAGGGMQIISHYQQEEAVDEEEQARQKREEESIYLPAGSIITGVMLNGMDAPTSQGSRRDPFPSTLRIQHEAILPNRFRADVRECFLIVSGYGDLSSERAYLRGETISCVREDGGVIESRLDAYAVGEDGKAGVRGRLVSKQGSMIARSMMAGFMSGAANAFDVDSIPVIKTGGDVGGKTEYQSNFNPKMFQGAAAQGASRALDRIAQFYVDMAEGIFPVIEVDAGRQVELIMTSGTNLQIRSPGRG